MQVASPLLDIFAPDIRNINFGLMNAAEKATIQNLVDTLISCATTFRREQQVRDAVVINLSPVA